MQEPIGVTEHGDVVFGEERPPFRWGPYMLMVLIITFVAGMTYYTYSEWFARSERLRDLEQRVDHLEKVVR